MLKSVAVQNIPVESKHPAVTIAGTIRDRTMDSLQSPRTPLPQNDSFQNVERAKLFDRLHGLKPDGQARRLLIIGGGIHGAEAARRASSLGFEEVVLLERGDFAGETSQASTKLAHGGYRYLPMFQFKQVLRALCERSKLFRNATNFVKAIPLWMPLEKSKGAWSGLVDQVKVILHRVGLTLYDAFLDDRRLRHTYVKAKELPRKSEASIFHSGADSLVGCYRLWDGQFDDDARYVQGAIYQAVERGAVALNHCGVEALEKMSGDKVKAHWKDEVSGLTGTTEFDAVLNCAGPFAPEFIKGGHRRLSEKSDATDYRQTATYSRGVHLFYKGQFRGDGGFVPMPGKRGRYFFVLKIPNEDVVMVGTTELKVDEPVSRPIPLPEEIAAIKEYVRDTPGLKGQLGEPYYAIAGIRTLGKIVSGNQSDTASTSRDHMWLQDESDPIFSLIGGKYTDAGRTAEEGLYRAAQSLKGRKFTGLRAKIHSMATNVLIKFQDWSTVAEGFFRAAKNIIVGLPRYQRVREVHIHPGCEYDPQGMEQFFECARKAGLGEKVVHRLVNNLGAQCKAFTVEMLRQAVTLGSSEVTNIEVLFHLRSTQAVTLEDLMRRRLSAHYLPDLGVGFLNDLVQLLQAERPERDWSSEAEKYRSTASEIGKLVLSA